MKKIISILLLATFCIFTQLHAQNRADELMKQAQENLTKKEYIKARYLFLQAYNAFATQDKYAQAVECGVNASALYHRENYYKEAFELLRGAEQVVPSAIVALSAGTGFSIYSRRQADAYAGENVPAVKFASDVYYSKNN